MAKVYRDGDGWKLVFTDHRRTRRTLRLARLPKKELESVGRRIELLVVSKISGEALDTETARWLANTGDELRDRLVRLDLCSPRQQQPVRHLGEFIAEYIDAQQVKPLTKVMMRQTRTALVDYFGAERKLGDISEGQAMEWNWWMRSPTEKGGHGVGEMTARRNCGRARQFFGHALALGLVDSNPFKNAKLATQVGPSPAARDFFVTREHFEALLAECPDQEWRAILALSRIGGLRIPSELNGLTWRDINWDRGTVLVRSPKLERYAGRETRLVPLFPELRRELWDLLTIRGTGPDDLGDKVISGRRCRNANLRTQFHRMCERAGVPKYPKPFANARATRATELAEGFPLHVVTAWMGHTAKVSERHYLRVTQEHYDAAAGGPAQKPAQIPAQPTTAQSGIADTDQQKTPGISIPGHCTPSLATDLSILDRGRTPLENPRENGGNTIRPARIPAQIEQADPLADLGAGWWGSLRDDPQLLRLVAAWRELSEDDRAEILSIAGCDDDSPPSDPTGRHPPGTARRGAHAGPGV